MLNLYLLCGLIFWCGRVFQHSVENKAFIMKLIILNQVGMLNMCCTGEQDANTMDGCIHAFSRDEVLIIVMIMLLHATRHDHGRPYSVEMLYNVEGIVTVLLLPCSIIVKLYLLEIQPCHALLIVIVTMCACMQ